MILTHSRWVLTHVRWFCQCFLDRQKCLPRHKGDDTINIVDDISSLSSQLVVDYCNTWLLCNKHFLNSVCISRRALYTRGFLWDLQIDIDISFDPVRVHNYVVGWPPSVWFVVLAVARDSSLMIANSIISGNLDLKAISTSNLAKLHLLKWLYESRVFPRL